MYAQIRFRFFCFSVQLNAEDDLSLDSDSDAMDVDHDTKGIQFNAATVVCSFFRF